MTDDKKTDEQAAPEPEVQPLRPCQEPVWLRRWAKQERPSKPAETMADEICDR